MSNPDAIQLTPGVTQGSDAALTSSEKGVTQGSDAA